MYQNVSISTNYAKFSEWRIYNTYTGIRRVWRHQRGNQNPCIKEEQTRQWPKEKVQKDKQRSTKHPYKTKDRVTRTPLKTGGELGCSGRVSSSCFINMLVIVLVSYHETVWRAIRSRKSKDRQHNGQKKISGQNQYYTEEKGG